MQKIKYMLAPEVLPNLDQGLKPFGIFFVVTRINELFKTVVTEITRYATQKMCYFDITWLS